MKFRNKMIAIFTIFTVFIQAFTTYLPINALSDLGNIFDLQEFKINGSVVNDGDFIEITEGMLAELSFTWDTDRVQGDVKSGDTAHAVFSPAFKTVNVSQQPILVNDEGQQLEVGVYWIENGVLYFEFNDNIEDSTIHEGTLTLKLEFDLDEIEDNRELELPFIDSQNHDPIKVVAKPNNVPTQAGVKVAQVDSKENTQEIKWSIEVMNTSELEQLNTVLSDQLPEGTVLKEGSLKVSEIYTKLSGNRTITEVTNGFSVTENTESFSITFDKVTPYNGYLVEYVTTITDFSKDTFVNNANYQVDETNLPLSDTVTGITRSNPVIKEGIKVSDHEIEWYIDVNKNRQGLNNPIVDDQLPEYLSIKPGSMKVVRLTQSGSNWLEASEVSIDGLGSFPLALGKMTSNDIYRVKFETEIDWSKVNDGDYSKDNVLSNTANLTDDGITYPSATEDVSFKRPNMLRKEGGVTLNYDTKEVTWKVVLNEARHPLGTVTIEDEIPAGLIFNASDLVVKDEQGQDVQYNLTTSGSSSVGTNLSIVVEDVGERVLTFEYKTTIEDFSKSSFNNSATANGIGIGIGGEKDNQTVNVPGNVYQKHYKGTNYNTKEMSWEIEINPRREAIKSLTIGDSYTQGGMILIPDSFVVVKVSNNTETVFTAGINEDFYVEAVEGSYTNGFNIVLNDKMLPLDGGKYFIRYKTSIDPQYEANGNTLNPHHGNNNRFINKVEFTGKTNTDVDINVGRESSPTLKEEVKAHGNKLGKLVHDVNGTINPGWKSGYDRQIEWTVHVNYLEQNFDNFEIKDQLQYDGEIIENSVVVKEYTIDDNGNIKTENYIDTPENYSMAIDGKNLTITFNEPINKRYVVIYRTTVPSESQHEYKNDVTVEADGIEYPYSATVRYANHGNFLNKTSNVTNNQAYTGDEVTWKVIVNESLSIIDNSEIHDMMSDGQVYVNGSLEINSYDKEGKVKWELDEDYTLEIEALESGETNLVIKPTNQLKTKLEIEYKSIITALEDSTINNTIKLYGGEDLYAQETSNSFNARQFSSVSGTWVPTRGGILLTKLDKTENLPIKNNKDSAEFELYMKINGELTLVGNYKLNEDGELRIGNLLLREYWLKEVKAPQGYELNSYESEEASLIYVNVNKSVKDVNDPDLVDAGTLTNTRSLTSFTATKRWENGPETKPSIQLQLLRNGESYGEPVTLAPGETSYTWLDLEETNIQGDAYVYTVDEVDVPENYSKNVNGSIITNTYVIPKIDITGAKVWVDGPSVRPDIQLQLYRDGEVYGTPVTLTNGETEYTWPDLDRTDIDGKAYVYTVQEVDVPENYEMTVSDDGLTITNTYVIPKIDITGTKVWINGPSVRPDIQLQLYRDGEAYGAPVTLTNGETNHVWTDLDRTDIDGNKYVYTVQEVDVPENYEMTISDDGLTITNTYVIPKIDITGTKVWIDGPSVRPDIQLQLYRDGEVYGAPVTLTNGETEYTWPNLDRTDIDGKAYVYTVREVDVPVNYEMTISDDGLTITNTYVIPKIDVTGTKVWENGPKPEIQLQLMRDGVSYGEPVILKSGTTEYVWTDLDRTDRAGNEYVYTVQEVDVPENYEMTTSDDGLTITNTYVIPKIDITGTKVWIDGPSVRPDIQLQLYRDGEVYGDPVTLTNGETEYTWLNLDRTDIDGNEYVYTVQEVDVPENYEMTISDDGLTITNTYVISKIDITGTKVWIDGPSVRPDIQLQLYRDGEAYGAPVTLTKGETNHVWTDLDRTDRDGNEYVYSVQEVDVPENYVMNVSEDGLTITNSYVIPLMDVSVTKIWVNGPELRPSITLQLYRDGVEFGEPVVLENGETRYTWFDLEATDVEGNRYTYSVDEIDVPEDYQKELSEDTLIITNTYHSPKIEITGTKVWIGGSKPSIEIQLYRNGVAYGDPVVLESGKTTYTWTNLDKNDSNGEAYVYTIDEVSVPEGYEKSISEDGLTITNKYVEETLPATGMSNTYHYVAYMLLLVGTVFILIQRKKYE